MDGSTMRRSQIKVPLGIHIGVWGQLFMEFQFLNEIYYCNNSENDKDYDLEDGDWWLIPN